MKHGGWLTGLRIAGLLGMLSSLLFVIVVIILMYLTPNYSFWRNTVSVLALGPYGQILTLSLVLLAAASFLLGSVFRSGRAFFWWLCLGLLLLAIFKLDLRLEQDYYNWKEIGVPGKIHFLTTLVGFPFVIFGVYGLSQKWKADKRWKNLVRLSHFVIYFSLLVGGVWLVLFLGGMGGAIKGLFQKAIILNLLVWSFIVSGYVYSQKGKLQ